MDSQSLPVAINEGLEQGFVVGDGLQDVAICRHVSDGPLSEPSAAEPENVAENHGDKGKPKRRGVTVSVTSPGSPARFMDEPLQTSFDLVVGQEGHVARVGHRQTVPVPQQGRPRLQNKDRRELSVTLRRKQPLTSWGADLEQPGEDVKLKHRDVVVAGQVDGRLQGHGLQAQTDGVELMESLAEGSPRHDGPAQVRVGSAGFLPKHIVGTTSSPETSKKAHLSPKERLQNSAASALVILKLSP